MVSYGKDVKVYFLSVQDINFDLKQDATRMQTVVHMWYMPSNAVTYPRWKEKSQKKVFKLKQIIEEKQIDP